MQRAMYPSPYMRITQGYHEGTHVDSFAIDDAGSDEGIDYLVAPFDCVVKKIYTQDANEVWIESLEPVLFADGTQDYMTILLCHDNDISDLWLGKIIRQGERFYEEGTKGMATGNHVHFECAKGRFAGSGWHQNSAGYWSINNGKKPEDCLWIDDTYTIMNTYGYVWKSVPKAIGNPVSRNESVNQVEILVDDLRCRRTPNGEVLGYINKGIYNYTNAIEQDGYWWFEIGQNMWIATAEGWTINYPKKEEGKDPKLIAELQQQLEEKDREIQEQKNQIKTLEETNSKDKIVISQLEATNLQNKDRINQLEKELENQPSLIFECLETDDYKIHLLKNEKLYMRS